MHTRVHCISHIARTVSHAPPGKAQEEEYVLPIIILAYCRFEGWRGEEGGKGGKGEGEEGRGEGEEGGGF